MKMLKNLILYFLVAIVLRQVFGTPITTILGFYLIITVHELGHVLTAVKYFRFRGLGIKNMNPYTIIPDKPRDAKKFTIVCAGGVFTLLFSPIIAPLFENNLQYYLFSFILSLPDMAVLYKQYYVKV